MTTEIKMLKKTSCEDRTLQHKTSRCVSTIIKPLRIFQLFTVLLLFVFMIYMIVMDPMPISALFCILLIVLSGVYIFILAVDLISYFSGGALHIISMAIFSFLGFIFFAIGGILLICYGYVQSIVQIIAITLCSLAALFFLIDITMIFGFWKRKCSVCNQVCCAQELLYKDKKPSTVEFEIMKHDVTTSLSDVRVPYELKGIALPDRCYRKVEYPRRREYVDCPTCVPSLRNLGIAQIQTEQKLSVGECQTPKTVTKETPMQTLSKCEFCDQQIQLPPAFPITEGNVVSGASCFQRSSQWSYPAIVQFVRGGVTVPCCPGCKCITGTTQTQQQQQQQQPQQRQTQKLMQERAESLMQKAKQKTPSKTLCGGGGPKQQFAEETTKMHSKIERPKTAGETTITGHSVQRKRSTDSMKRSEKQSDGEDEYKIERSKGGGELCARLYQEFLRTTETRSTTNLEKSPRNRMLITPLSNRTKLQALVHPKSNKVNPVKDTNTSDEDDISERIISRTFDNQAAQGDEDTILPNAIIDQINDACPLCRQQERLTPTSDTFKCYTVFKSRTGRYFCESCAPMDSKKLQITSKLEGADLEKLQCANCRLHFRNRRVKTKIKLKPNTCPKCGRPQ